MGQRGKAQGGANLCRCQPLARRQASQERIAHRCAFKRAAHQGLARTGRRRTQLQVIGKAPPEGRIDLLDAVGHPDGGHGIGFENLVHPGLATDRMRHRSHHLLGTRELLRRLAADRWKHVLDLIEQQRGTRAALEKHLRDLQRAVTVATA